MTLTVDEKTTEYIQAQLVAFRSAPGVTSLQERAAVRDRLREAVSDSERDRIMRLLVEEMRTAFDDSQLTVFRAVLLEIPLRGLYALEAALEAASEGRGSYAGF